MFMLAGRGGAKTGADGNIILGFMVTHPHPDPVAFEVFGFGVHWYGLMYLLGFVVAWYLAGRQVRKRMFAAVADIGLDNLIAAAAFGVILGGRLGYVLFYKPAHYFGNPVEILQMWEGGMSFHGGLLGVVASLWVVARAARRSLPAAVGERHLFLRLLDFAAIITPPGLGLGRLGNFINAELPGRVSDGGYFWLFNFGFPDSEPRHPSQLYQLAFEGVFLLVLMLWLARRPRAAGWLAGVFVFAYGCGRFGIEFFREPDRHLGLLAWGLSAGQWLSLPMLVLGLALMYRERLASLGTQLQAWQQKRAAAAAAKAEAANAEVEDEDDVAEDAVDDVATEATNKQERETKPAAAAASPSPASLTARVGSFFKSLLDSDSDEDAATAPPTLTRREKRRMKKKKA